MPELPEVETIRRDLQKTVQGLKVLGVDVLDGRVIRQSSAVTFSKKVIGRSVRMIERRGKALVFDLGQRFLVVQPMMTGQLVAVPPGAKVRSSRDTRVIFRLSKNWNLLYNDQRLFGRLQIVDDLNEIKYFREIGPEPLGQGFSPDVLAESLNGRKTPIKTLLLDHRVVAGIGNIYAAEILFRAGIDPQKASGTLGSKDVERLYQEIRCVLTEAVRARGTSVRNYRDGSGREGKYLKLVRVYGRDGQPCRICGEKILKIVQSQRSTFFCPRCQKVK